jgi:hypothetical protein
MGLDEHHLALKAFLRFFTGRYGESALLPAAMRPMALLEVTERDDPARAPGHLRMAVNNCLELSAHWPLGQVMALDCELHALGVLTLSQARHRVWGRFAAMVKHGTVRAEADHQVLRAALADAALAADLSAEQRDRLVVLDAAFVPSRSAEPAQARHLQPRPRPSSSGRPGPGAAHGPRGRSHGSY